MTQKICEWKCLKLLKLFIQLKGILQFNESVFLSQEKQREAEKQKKAKRAKAFIPPEEPMKKSAKSSQTKGTFHHATITSNLCTCTYY